MSKQKLSIGARIWLLAKTRAVDDWPGALRMAADAILVAASYALGMTIRFFLAVETNGFSHERVQQFTIQTMHGLEVLVPICVLTFNFFGFYNRTRRFSIQYKMLVIFQGVSVGYLLSGFLAFFASEYVGFSRGGLFLGYSVCVALFWASRLASNLWRLVVLRESGDEAATLAVRHAAEKRVLLIGGGGYIGSALLPKLLEAGFRVRLLDVFLYGKEPIQDHLNHSNLEIVEGDFRRIEKVVAAMRNVGTVIHLGAIVGDPACALDETLTIEINLVATRMIAEVAKGAGVRRFVFASTCSVYGASDGMLDERSLLNPISLYARSKIASERVLLENRDGDFAPVILRFGTIFGFSGRTRFDLVVNLLAAKAIFDGKITLFGGDQWRPFVHVEDAARAVMAVLEAPIQQVRGEVFNVGDNEMNFTLRQVGEVIQQMVPAAVLVDSGSNADRRNYRVDFSKVRHLTGYRTQWTLEAGVQQVIDAIQAGKVTDYSLPKYSNVKHLNAETIRLLGTSTGWETKILQSVTPFEPTVTSFTTRQ